MMQLVFVKYGCYVGEVTDVWETDLSKPKAEDLLNDELYERAYEYAQGYEGLHGFCEFDDDEFENDEERAEAIHEYLENHIEYYWELFDPEKHEGQLYSSMFEPIMKRYNELNAQNSGEFRDK